MEKDIEQKKAYISILKKIKNLLFKNRRRTIIVLVIIINLIFFVWRVFGQQKRSPQYQTAQVQKGTIISTVNESGNITSNSQAGVGSPTTGVVQEIYVKNGD